jgi:uncharacterized protein YbjT (DUF2867 family)
MRAISILGDQVEIVEGDVRDPKVVSDSLAGKDAAIIALSAMNWKLIKEQQSIEKDAVLSIIDQAKKLHCHRVIYLSGYEIRKDILEKLGILDFGAIKLEIEATLAESGLNYTILGCPPAYRLFFALLKNGKITIPGGGKKRIPTVAAEDVGTIGAQCALRNDISAARLRVPGPKTYSIPDVAALMTTLSGKTIGVRAVPLAGLRFISYLIQPFNPFLRELYKTLKLLNHFPEDLADQVPEDHRKLKELFDYSPKSLEEEIMEHFKEGENGSKVTRPGS